MQLRGVQGEATRHLRQEHQNPRNTQQKTTGPLRPPKHLLAVPNPKIGGQKIDTMPPVKKTPAAQVKKHLWKGSKRKHVPHTREIEGSIRRTERQGSSKRRAEIYLSDDNGYIAGLTSSHSAFKTKVDALKIAIEDGRITTTWDAKRFLAE